MAGIVNPNQKNAITLAEKLFLCSKYAQTPTLSSIHLIDLKDKSIAFEFIEESKCQLRYIICDLYKQYAGVVSGKREKFTPHLFIPVKISSRGNCVRCENTFVIRIKQFQQRDLRSTYSQYHSTIAGKKFSDHPSVDHLNLIDYFNKVYDFVPYLVTEDHQNHTYPHLLSLIETTILNCHPQLLCTFLWKCIRVLKLLNMETDSSLSVKCYNRIVELTLEMWNYENHLTNLFKTVFFSEPMIVTFIEQLTNHLPHRTNERLKCVLDLASCLRFNLYGAWVRGRKVRDFSNCPVTAALLSGNREQMSILLEYGFMPNSRPIGRYNVYLRRLIRINVRLCIPFGVASVRGNLRVREVLMFLILMHAVNDFPLSGEMRDCLHHLWSIMPHAFVTKQELVEEIDHILLQFPGDNKTAEIRREMLKTIDCYDRTFFGDIMVTMPRSLQHLSGCRVRNLLTLAGRYPRCISYLQISKNLQEYIRMKNCPPTLAEMM